ncbi:MAG: hypothetical protein WKF94_19760 [Solirubrobacteraceae bacterium]
MSSDLPLLLVDVDGVLSLFGFDAVAPPPGRMALIDGAPHLLSFEAAAVLRAVGDRYACTWCTGWEERADEHLPWLLDLPRGWPHVPLSAARGPGHGIAGHWKLDAIDAFAGPGHPLAWVDDALDGECRAWAAARAAPTLLVECDPAIGLVKEGEEALLRFAASVMPRSGSAG